MITFVVDVFPLFGGLSVGPFLWKALAFGVCWYLNTVRPSNYLWSALFTLALLPAVLLRLYGGDTSDVNGLAAFVNLYLCWMCAEVAFQSANAEPEERIHGWWALPLLLIIVL